MFDRGASYAVKQMRYSRCSIAVASDCAVRCSFHACCSFHTMDEREDTMDEREDGLVVDVEEAKHIKSYTAAFKLQVIREAKETSRRAAAKRFGVDPKRVRQWLANENKLLHAPKDKRIIGRCG